MSHLVHELILALQNKTSTIYIVGSNEEFAGTLLSIGDDFITLEAQPTTRPIRRGA